MNLMSHEGRVKKADAREKKEKGECHETEY
jgi:hypothetical protein